MVPHRIRPARHWRIAVDRVVLAVSLAVWEIFSAAIERNLAGLGQAGAPARNRRRTLLPLLRTTMLCVIVVVAGLTVLSQLGINIAPLLAGAGVIGLAVGFGSQALVKDVITGLFILMEDQIAVGDIVDLGKEHAGVVEAISIRTIRLRDLGGIVHTVPFSEVTSVKNLTKDFSFVVARVAIAYRETIDEVVELLRGVCDELAEDAELGPFILDRFDYLGVDSLNEFSLVLMFRVRTLPAKQWAVGRALNRRIKMAFDAHGITIRDPSPGQDHRADARRARRAGSRRTDPLRGRGGFAAGSVGADPAHRLTAPIRDDVVTARANFRSPLYYGVALIVLALTWAGSGWGGVPAGNRAPVILAFGDSLTAGFGLPAGQSFPEQLEQALRARGIEARVVECRGLWRHHGGRVGATRLVACRQAGSRDPRARRQRHAARHRAVRGALQPRQDDREDQGERRQAAARRHARLAELGQRYKKEFDRIYPELARAHGVALYPFFLDGVAMDPELNQPDGLHPNRRGVARIVERIAPRVAELLGDRS